MKFAASTATVAVLLATVISPASAKSFIQTKYINNYNAEALKDWVNQCSPNDISGLHGYVQVSGDRGQNYNVTVYCRPDQDRPVCWTTEHLGADATDKLVALFNAGLTVAMGSIPEPGPGGVQVPIVLTVKLGKCK
jgi:hypothetical protein